MHYYIHAHDGCIIYTSDGSMHSTHALQEHNIRAIIAVGTEHRRALAQPFWKSTITTCYLNNTIRSYVQLVPCCSYCTERLTSVATATARYCCCYCSLIRLLQAAVAAAAAGGRLSPAATRAAVPFLRPPQANVFAQYAWQTFSHTTEHHESTTSPRVCWAPGEVG